MLLLVTQEAVTSMPVLGFSVGTRKVLLLGGEVLRTDIFSFLTKCNSGSSNNIEKNEVYYFPSVHILICTYDEGKLSFLCRVRNFSRFISVISQIHCL